MASPETLLKFRKMVRPILAGVQINFFQKGPFSGGVKVNFFKKLPILGGVWQFLKKKNIIFVALGGVKTIVGFLI